MSRPVAGRITLDELAVISAAPRTNSLTRSCGAAAAPAVALAGVLRFDPADITVPDGSATRPRARHHHKDKDGSDE